VPEIDEFWSHSWHGEARRKILLLLLLKNGPAAILVGTLGALVMMILQVTGVVPGLYRKPPLLGDGATYEFAPYSLLVGIGLCTLTILLWRPQQAVFLDQICIHQHDGSLKMEGILNIGAIMKKSRSLLVLWDQTYVERLWCIFEMAAFLKGHESEEVDIVVRPTFLAPWTCYIFASWCVFGSFDLFVPYVSMIPVMIKFILIVPASCFLTGMFCRYYRAIQRMQGYAERAAQWSRGELPDWDVAVSGPASKAEADELKPFFDWLGSFLSSRNISSIVDVSSGHWPSGWQRGVKWSGQDYTGLDITPKMIEDNRAFFKDKDPQQYGLRSVAFEVGDMLKELPKADLLITKDTIIHVPNWAILKFLETNVNACPPRYKEVLFIHDRPPYWKFRWGAVPLVRHIVRNWDCPGFSDFHEIDLRVAPYHLDVVNLFEFNSSTRADRVMDNPKVVQYLKTSCPGS
ncbi:unnamed protein product, partial [Symbiodinium sp. KB8]